MLSGYAAEVRYLRFSEVSEILTAFARTEDPPKWDSWVRDEDREVRVRIDRGVEDSISNLALYGTSFTRLPRLESAESATAAGGGLTDAARARLHAFAGALPRTVTEERLRFARDYLLQRHIKPEDCEPFLATNLARFSVEQRGYQEKLKSAAESGDPAKSRMEQATLYEQRGLSVDTSLLPNFALEDTLRAMLRKQAVSAGQMHRIAVIGPGLDFADKRDGYDFYPLQSIQPFAVAEAVIRLGLGKAGDVKVTAFDLNPAVIAHLKGISRREGRPYVLQLPRLKTADWTPEAIAYWSHFGETIGASVAPAKAPEGVEVRAVAIPARYGAMIEALDLNVVAQVLDPPPGSGFDLVVATNILVYYDRFQQALAMESIGRMMNSGGIFLSNTILPAQKPALLEYLGRRSVTYSASGAYGDDIVAYRRK